MEAIAQEPMIDWPQQKARAGVKYGEIASIPTNEKGWALPIGSLAIA